mmetsp:Transcript_44677/g.87622  ORF Transcript_44677/g.87622 Transcript_44677/m.87622 type:complete len:84 (+) Transcript_44677:703-954(+)
MGAAASRAVTGSDGVPTADAGTVSAMHGLQRDMTNLRVREEHEAQKNLLDTDDSSSVDPEGIFLILLSTPSSRYDSPRCFNFF